MKKKNRLLAVFATGLLAGPLVAQAQGYDYESIVFPGTDQTQVFGINERGEVSGIGFTVFTERFPFVYDAKRGTFTSVAPVADFDTTSVLGIADNGVLVGSVRKFGANSPFDDEDSGLIIDKNGASTVFDHPDALFFTEARAINNRGLVTGFRDNLADADPFSGPFVVGFIYHPKTDTFTDIETGISTIAQGINERGDVVGSAVIMPQDDPCKTVAGFPVYGWLRTTDGNISYFTVNGGQTFARGISDSGTIGGFAFDISAGNIKGFVTEFDGTQCQDISIDDADLLQFPGALDTFVQGITNSGTVVGIWVDDQFLQRGFVATPQ